LFDKKIAQNSVIDKQDIEKEILAFLDWFYFKAA
jgi:hypothetical protein